MKILVTGGTGYIGSHTIVELVAKNHEVIVVDNLSNSTKTSLERVEKITGQPIEFHEFDLCDKTQLASLFDQHSFEAVIHFAGLKAVGESIQRPLLYYHNNLESTLALLEVMDAHGVRNMVFSSSATVYGTPSELPLKETSMVGVGITNPYGQTKHMIEQILADVSAAGDNWNITSLRYFNPIGAHESGLIGEDPDGPPNNLLPYIVQVAVGKLDSVKVFGDDYDTSDGTGIRDYIHVVDLAKAHVTALEHLNHPNLYKAYNIGTGHGTSVLEAVHAVEKTAGKAIPYEIVPRRPGDVATCYADCTLAEKELGWKAEKTFQKGCNDAWNWQSNNPNGYK